MDFLIITGLSGAGKSRAADVLEDLDYYCVDNLPTALLTKFAELCLATRGRYERVALVTDVRGQESFTELFAALDGRREDFLPAGRLQDGDAVVSLQVAYFTGDAHAVGKRRQEGDVQLVDGEPQFVQFQLAFRIFGRPVAQHKLLHEHAKLFGRELLPAVRKSGRRIDVGFDHKPLEIKIQSLLCDFLHQRGVACDMGRIAEAWQARQTAL